MNTSIFPSSWKISNVCPIFKSGDSAITSNYRPVSLLNTLAKVFERIIFKHVFNHLNDTNFFTPSQSGFLPGDSTVNQVVYLYDKICKALDEGLEIRVIFFDISKAFDKIWHKRLLYKLHKAGIGGKLLSWFSDYLSNRYQRVVLPGAVSDLSSINAGVPQGSILGPLLFLVYIYDKVNDIESNIDLFADDTSLSMVVGDPDTTGAILQTDINRIIDWANRWLVKFNPSKSESLIISRKRNKPVHPELFMSGVGIPSVQVHKVHKHLGIFISNDGSWDYHVNQSLTKAWKRIGIMRRLKLRLDRTSLQTIYFSFIRPILEYADVIWMNLSQYQKDQIEKVQNEAVRIVTGCSKLVSLTDLNKESGWETLSERKYKHKLIFFLMVNRLSPSYLNSLVPDTIGSTSSYSLRDSHNIQNIACRTNLYLNSFLPSAFTDWNALPIDIRILGSLSAFKCYINRDKIIPKKLYFFGERRIQVIHARLRTNCSSLHQHLYFRNIIDSPLCACGEIESNQHYFFDCRYYREFRDRLFQSVSKITTVSLHTLLFGDETLSLADNEKIFSAVHSYIVDTVTDDHSFKHGCFPI